MLAEVGPADGSLLDAQLARAGWVYPPRRWDLDQVPAHLHDPFRVLDAAGTTLGEGKDLDALKRRLAPSSGGADQAAGGIEVDGLRDWTIDALPAGGRAGRGARLPGAGRQGDASPSECSVPRRSSGSRWAGTRRLLLLAAVAGEVRDPVAGQPGEADALAANPHGGVAALLDDVLGAAADALIADAGGPAWDAEGFAALRAAAGAELGERTVAVLAEVERILAGWQRVSSRLDGPRTNPATDDMRAQLDALVYPGFVTATGAVRLPDVARYLRGVELRLDKLPGRVQRDADWMRQVHDMDQAADAVESDEARDRIRWMIEELRVSLFAQELRTAHPVSPQRILRAIDELP